MSNTMIFGLKTYAPSPVWSGSIAGPVRFQPLTKREAARRYHQARRFERQILHARPARWRARPQRLGDPSRLLVRFSQLPQRAAGSWLSGDRLCRGDQHQERRQGPAEAQGGGCAPLVAPLQRDRRRGWALFLAPGIERLFGQPDITMERLPRGAAACCSRMGRSALRREGALDRGARGAAGRRQRRGDAQRPCRGWRRRWPGRGAAEARAGGVLSVCHIGEETRTSFRFS